MALKRGILTPAEEMRLYFAYVCLSVFCLSASVSTQKISTDFDDFLEGWAWHEKQKKINNCFLVAIRTVRIRCFL